MRPRENSVRGSDHASGLSRRRFLYRSAIGIALPTVVGLCPLPTAGARGAQDATPVAAVARQPGDLHRLFVAGVNARDLDVLMGLYEPDATITDLEGNPVRGADKLRQFLAGWVAAVKQIDAETRRVLVVEDFALLSSAYSAVMVAPDGEEFSVTGISGEVAWPQPDGTWRFLIDDPVFCS